MSDIAKNANTPLVEGKYLMYKDRPLVREGDTICYGDMTEKYILVMEIMTYKNDAGEQLPDQILVQVLESGNMSKIVRQGFMTGLQEAFSSGLKWLEHALAQNA